MLKKKGDKKTSKERVIFGDIDLVFDKIGFNLQGCSNTPTEATIMYDIFC